MDMTEIEVKEPIEFILNDRKFKYNFELLSSEQAELAYELGLYKERQKEVTPSSFKDVIKAKGAEWKLLLMSFLLTEYKDDVKQLFNIDTADKTLALLKNANYSKNRAKFDECIKDFFQECGRPDLASTIFSNQKKLNAIEILSPLMTGLMTKQNVS